MSKDTLLTRVWPNVVVEENNLQVHISALRRVLDEGNTGETFLVTVPGRGYRLIGMTAGRSRDEPKPRPGPAVPDKPSIAVIPFTNIERRSAAGILRGRDRRGHHHGAVARALAVRDRAQFELRLQGPQRRHQAGGRRARRALRARGQRAQGREPGQDHRPADRCIERRAPVGRTLRRRARRHLRPAGPGDVARRRRDRAEAAAGRDRAGEAQADREPRRVRLLSARHRVRPPDVAGDDERGIGGFSPGRSSSTANSPRPTARPPSATSCAS